MHGIIPILVWPARAEYDAVVELEARFGTPVDAAVAT